mmetsp:Transcript_6739/g.8999  ORF Transcript_6739/g.8999 Transcript_6739/m.8999 type:complete len:216 (-) Transcript_6739:181-828(-)
MCIFSMLFNVLLFLSQSILLLSGIWSKVFKVSIHSSPRFKARSHSFVPSSNFWKFFEIDINNFVEAQFRCGIKISNCERVATEKFRIGQKHPLKNNQHRDIFLNCSCNKLNVSCSLFCHFSATKSFFRFGDIVAEKTRRRRSCQFQNKCSSSVEMLQVPFKVHINLGTLCAIRRVKLSKLFSQIFQDGSTAIQIKARVMENRKINSNGSFGRKIF